MGKRARRRESAPLPHAPTADHTSDDGSQVLSLRCVMTAKTRSAYAQTLAGNQLSQEDAWQRAVEFLFERLALRWTIHDVATEGQKDLLLRLRASTADERRFVRDALRAHCAEWFPDVQAP